MNKNYGIIFSLIFCLTVLVVWGGVAQANELTLEDSIEIARENNLRLSQLKYDMEIARAGIKGAEAAGRPEVSFVHSYTRQEEQDLPEFDFELDGIELPDLSSDLEESFPMFSGEIFYTEIGAQYPLYTGGRLKTAVRQAETGLELAELQYRREEIKLAREVAENYFGVLQAQAAVDLNQEFLAQAEEFLKLTENQYEAGMVTESDVLQAEAEKAGVERSLRQAETALQMAERNFTYLLGLPSYFNFQLQEVEIENYQLPVELENALRIASENNPDLLLLEKNKTMTEHSVDMAEAEKKPNIFVSGDYSWQDSEWGLNNGNWNITLGLSYDLFDGGRRDAEIESARAEKKQVADRYCQAWQGIEMGLEQIYFQMEELQDSAEFLEKQKEAVRENLELTNIRYEAELVTALEVTSAQTELRHSQLELIQNKYEFLSLQAQLAELMGFENIRSLF